MKNLRCSRMRTIQPQKQTLGGLTANINTDIIDNINKIIVEAKNNKGEKHIVFLSRMIMILKDANNVIEWKNWDTSTDSESRISAIKTITNRYDSIFFFEMMILITELDDNDKPLQPNVNFNDIFNYIISTIKRYKEEKENVYTILNDIVVFYTNNKDKLKDDYNKVINPNPPDQLPPLLDQIIKKAMDEKGISFLVDMWTILENANNDDIEWKNWDTSTDSESRISAIKTITNETEKFIITISNAINFFYKNVPYDPPNINIDIKIFIDKFDEYKKEKKEVYRILNDIVVFYINNEDKLRIDKNAVEAGPTRKIPKHSL